MAVTSVDIAGAESGLRRVSRRIPAVAAGLALAGVCLVLARAGEGIGMPAPQLLIATVVGAAVAVLSSAEKAAPARAARASHALIGVLMGSYLRPEALQDATGIVLASLAATIATIAVCTLTALLLARLSAVTRVDALLGLTPGGSASIIASASQLGADAWQVACAQYLRVAMVAVTAPLLVVALTAHTRHPSAATQYTFTWPDVAHVVEQPGGISPLLVLIATNHLGHFALTGLLLPVLAKGSEPRVVTVSSYMYRYGRLDDARARYSHTRAYAGSKLANVLFGLELRRRLDAAASPVRSYLAHPGMARTGMQGKNSSRLQAVLGAAVARIAGRPAELGALPLLYAATAPEAPQASLIGPGSAGVPIVEELRPVATDIESARVLWESSEEATGVRYA